MILCWISMLFQDVHKKNSNLFLVPLNFASVGVLIENTKKYGPLKESEKSSLKSIKNNLTDILIAWALAPH